MAEDCPFYETETLRTQRRTIGSAGRTSTSAVPWCALPEHSPAPRDTALGTIGGGRRLTCGGDTDRCPVRDRLIAALSG